VLPRRASPYQESYRRHFRCPVRFNQEMAAIAVPARNLDHRVTEADPLPRALLAERVRPMKGGPGSECPDDIRRLLRMRLTSNRCSADEIARQLLHDTQGRSPRSRRCRAIQKPVPSHEPSGAGRAKRQQRGGTRGTMSDAPAAKTVKRLSPLVKHDAAASLQ
jgi:hypothetical protein